MTRFYPHAVSAALLIAARVSLMTTSLATTRRILARLARPMRVRADPGMTARTLDAVARRLPWKSTCLHQALAGEALLNAAGHGCELRIGARKTDGRHEFHAWLQSVDDVVVGTTDLAYIELTPRNACAS